MSAVSSVSFLIRWISSLLSQLAAAIIRDTDNDCHYLNKPEPSLNQFIVMFQFPAFLCTQARKSMHGCLNLIIFERKGRGEGRKASHQVSESAPLVCSPSRRGEVQQGVEATQHY